MMRHSREKTGLAIRVDRSFEPPRISRINLSANGSKFLVSEEADLVKDGVTTLTDDKNVRIAVIRVMPIDVMSVKVFSRTANTTSTSARNLLHGSIAYI